MSEQIRNVDKSSSAEIEANEGGAEEEQEEVQKDAEKYVNGVDNENDEVRDSR